MAESIDGMMERASAALSRMDYPTCERLCERALSAARKQEDWAYYSRILLPLQEARRQRRMTAAEGMIRLGTAGLAGEPGDWLAVCEAGCIAVTRPHDAETARQLLRLARNRLRFVEVLLADNEADASAWTLRSLAGPAVQCRVAAPPRAWRDRWLAADEPAPAEAGDAPDNPAALTAADWFLDADEKLGDAAMAQALARPRGLSRIKALEQALLAATDHELLHQRLADEARAICLPA